MHSKISMVVQKFAPKMQICKLQNCVVLSLMKNYAFGQDKDSKTYLIKLTLHFHNGLRVIHVLLTFTSPSRHFENGELG